MTFREEIEQKLKEAMKAKDQVALRAIKAIKSAILLEETSATGGEVNKEKGLQIIAKLAKQGKDSSQQYKDAGREDLANKEDEEVKIFEQFLPKQLSESELEEVVNEIIKENKLDGIKSMSTVMKLTKEKVGETADNKSIGTIAKRMLQG